MYKHTFLSTANLKCTPSDRRIYPQVENIWIANYVIKTTFSELLCCYANSSRSLAKGLCFFTPTQPSWVCANKIDRCPFNLQFIQNL